MKKMLQLPLLLSISAFSAGLITISTDTLASTNPSSSITQSSNTHFSKYSKIGQFKDNNVSVAQGSTRIGDNVFTVYKNKDGQLAIQSINTKNSAKNKIYSGSFGNFVGSTTTNKTDLINPLGHANSMAGYKNKQGNIVLLIPRMYGDKIAQVEISNGVAKVTNFITIQLNGQPVTSIGSIVSFKADKNGKAKILLRLNQKQGFAKGTVNLSDKHQVANMTSSFSYPDTTSVISSIYGSNFGNKYNVPQVSFGVNNRIYTLVDKIKADESGSAGSIIVEMKPNADNTKLSATGRTWKGTPNESYNRWEPEDLTVSSDGYLMTNVSIEKPNLDRYGKKQYDLKLIKTNWKVSTGDKKAPAVPTTKSKVQSEKAVSTSKKSKNTAKLHSVTAKSAVKSSSSIKKSKKQQQTVKTLIKQSKHPKKVVKLSVKPVKKSVSKKMSNQSHKASSKNKKISVPHAGTLNRMTRLFNNLKGALLNK